MNGIAKFDRAGVFDILFQQRNGCPAKMPVQFDIPVDIATVNMPCAMRSPKGVVAANLASVCSGL